jgi:hypothetical protein
LELRSVLKNHIAKLRLNSIDLEEFISTLENNAEIQEIVKKYPAINLTFKDVLNYTKTIGEIFWLKNNPALSRTIFLRYNYILSCLKLFIRHDLVRSNFQYNAESVFKKLAIYETEEDFNKAVSVFRKYGIMEYNLIKAICFDEIQMNRNQIEDALDFLRNVLVLYKSTPFLLDDKCPFFQVILPVMCSTSYETERKEKMLSDNWDTKLYSDNYELFFMRLDQLRKYKDVIKMKNAVKKQRALWSSTDGAMDSEMFFNVYEMEEANNENASDEAHAAINASSFFEARISPLKSAYIDSIREFEFKDESAFIEKYKRKYFIEISTIFKFDYYFFNKLSSLMQDFVLERFDWNDVILARDLNENFFKIHFEKVEKVCSKIVVEIKYAEVSHLIDLKKKFVAVIENLFEFYPGLHFNLAFRSDS